MKSTVSPKATRATRDRQDPCGTLKKTWRLVSGFNSPIMTCSACVAGKNAQVYHTIYDGFPALWALQQQSFDHETRSLVHGHTDKEE
jgi:hypothetical protein